MIDACLLTYAIATSTPTVWVQAVHSSEQLWDSAGWNIVEVDPAANPDITFRIGEYIWDQSHWDYWAKGYPMSWWGGYYNPQTKEIVLNDNRRYYPGDQKKIVAHELGHALGFLHDPDPTTLMAQVPQWVAPPTCQEIR